MQRVPIEALYRRFLLVVVVWADENFEPSVMVRCQFNFDINRLAYTVTQSSYVTEVIKIV